MSTPTLSIICAMDSNRLIGRNNALPSHLPADLAFFKRTTMGKPIIMGRKTFESIGRPLPGRQNIVVTRDRSYRFDGCDCYHSIEEALDGINNADEAMLIGGASLYQQTLHMATQLYLTQIHHAFEGGDAWFPAIDPEDWTEDWREDHEADDKNAHAYSFIRFLHK